MSCIFSKESYHPDDTFKRNWRHQQVDKQKVFPWTQHTFYCPQLMKREVFSHWDARQPYASHTAPCHLIMARPFHYSPNNTLSDHPRTPALFVSITMNLIPTWPHSCFHSFPHSLAGQCHYESRVIVTDHPSASGTQAHDEQLCCLPHSVPEWAVMLRTWRRFFRRKQIRDIFELWLIL